MVGTEGLAQGVDHYADVAFLDKKPRPDGLDQLALLHQMAAALNQEQQDIEGPGSESYSVSIAQQLPFDRVQPKRAELV
jgi:hypothetical protein